MSHCPPHVSKFLTVSKDLEGMLRVVYPKAISQSRSHPNPLVFGVKMYVWCVHVDTGSLLQKWHLSWRSRLLLPFELTVKKAHAQQIYTVQTSRLGKWDLSALKVRCFHLPAGTTDAYDFYSNVEADYQSGPHFSILINLESENNPLFCIHAVTETFLSFYPETIHLLSPQSLQIMESLVGSWLCVLAHCLAL